MRALLMALAVAAVAAPAGAADPKLSQLRLGEERVGKKPSADDLAGKVVLVEVWGIN
jgi:hypothetical protein